MEECTFDYEAAAETNLLTQKGRDEEGNWRGKEYEWSCAVNNDILLYTRFQP